MDFEQLISTLINSVIVAIVIAITNLIHCAGHYLVIFASHCIK